MNKQIDPIIMGAIQPFLDPQKVDTFGEMSKITQSLIADRRLLTECLARVHSLVIKMKPELVAQVVSDDIYETLNKLS